ncbi:MAG: putative transposase [Candidatus Methanoperedens nitroreducens]|uniref:Putative transposase n=1 Tax=Candidatus Methanoperedens nitratireducens TaxID=1392998 RepID=A0A0P8ACH5_9EURY|nr:RNA-guided endonuclease TnpB family protein [Candidatus Methanoperedens sp. BLZ2]KAB2948322.1 MAG: IS200/IS605 family element transposase accessory protein TnpB [Candidatus Methanoperedens sp.]KPQ41790.1 MAG: putative transposase [Candidatus Methanoperedens sp. BLZ1]MBZ0176480.1 transposase [Candidatus Methanoperedens nitroreducens]MCX9077029.1 transposase [Candidatus Methanoperedens sp.]
MNLIRTEQIQIEGTDELSSLCHLSKNLWNEANYLIRQEFFMNGNWIRSNTLAATLKTSENYKNLNAQTAQQILKVLDRSWNSFFKAIKEWSKNPDKFIGRPKIPNYKPRDGEALLIFTNQQVTIKDHILSFTKKLPLKIKTRLLDNTNLREVRLIPKGLNYICEIIYKKQSEVGEINKRWYAKIHNGNRVIGIDLGLRNVVTIANNIGEIPIVIKGGILKSMNQYYNKEKAQLQSIYDKQGIKFGTRMSQLNSKRNHKIKDTMHKISRYTIDYCLENNIGTIVIGKNDNWKQEANMGKKNNQNFVQIPHFKLIQMLQYKAETEGITVKLQQESHTSKCSFLDSEPICHQETYKGVRFTRGLFRSENGTILNSDVNGAYNIIRKAIPDAFAKGIEGVGLHPIRSNAL